MATPELSMRMAQRSPSAPPRKTREARLCPAGAMSPSRSLTTRRSGSLRTLLSCRTSWASHDLDVPKGHCSHTRNTPYLRDRRAPDHCNDAYPRTVLGSVCRALPLGKLSLTSSCARPARHSQCTPTPVCSVGYDV